MPTNNAWNAPNFEAWQDQFFSGFHAWSGAGVYWSLAGTDFTVERGGTGYIRNTPVTWAGGQTVAGLAAGDTYYIYMDSTGTIGSTATRTTSLFQNNIVLFEVMVDAASNVIVVRENHPYDFPTASSEYLHYTIGPVIENTLGGANITLNGTKAIQINGQDYLADHGLTTTIPDSGGVAETFSFMYTNGAGKWVRDSIANTFPSTYNNAGTPTALTAGRFGVFRLYASKDTLNTSTPTYYAVMHRAQFTNLSQANTAIANGTIAAATNEFYNIEVAQLGYVVKSQASDTIVNVVISKGTPRASTSGATSNSASLVNTTTTNFNGWLSSLDTTVQASLDTLDDVLIGGTAGQIVTSSGAGAKPVYTTAVYPATTGAGTIVLSNAANTVTSGASLTGDFTFTSATAGSSRVLTVTNTDNSNTASHAVVKAVAGGTSGGDGKFQSIITGGQTWSLGGDNSDSDAFVISGNDALGTTNVMRVSTAGEINYPLQPAFSAYLASPSLNKTGAGASYGIGTDALTEIFDQNGDFTTAGVFTAPITGRYLFTICAYGTGCSTTSDILLQANGSNRGFINRQLRPASGNDIYSTMTFILDMDAADTLSATVTISGEAGNTVDIYGEANFRTGMQGYLLC